MKALRTKRVTLQTSQDGFASLVISIVLVLVLSLLTVGFAQLMNKETRSALDKQLASQAYYAAESGINDAATVISNNPDVSKSTCGPTAPGPGSLFPNNKVGNSTGASYPCLLINPTPLDLEYAVNTQQSKLTELQAVDSDGNPKAVDSMVIGWQDSGGTLGFASASNCNGGGQNTFPPAAAPSGAWTATGIVRAQLIPITDLSRDGLTNNTYTAFLCPQSGGGTPTSAPYTDNKGTAGGGVISGNCKNPNGGLRYCSVAITGLSALNQSTFFLNLRAIYNPVDVTVRIFGADVSHTQLNIAKAQILVDSTGKAQDVLKRIQVRIPAHNTYASPDDGTEAMSSICKQLQLTPASAGGSVRGGSSTDCSP